MGSMEACTGDAADVQGTDGVKDEEGTTASEPVVDLYESRVGEFRMMTFFAIRDIAKGMQSFPPLTPQLSKLATGPTPVRFCVFFC